MPHLSPQLLPSGRLVARPHDEAAPLPPAAAERLAAAFSEGPGPGLLHLAAAETTTELPPAWRWLRTFAQGHLSAAARVPELDARWASLDLPPPTEDDLCEAILSAPPFPGQELLRPDQLRDWWAATGAAFRAAATTADSVHDWLQARGAGWSAVGRVCLHLAENRRDPNHPFAFLATFAAGLGADGRPRHLPLAKALQQARGDRAWLDALLSPVHRAATESSLLREFIESRALFRPQRWTAAQAHAFLLEVPALEQAGLVLRVPDWWAKGRRRAQVAVTLGPAGKGILDARALLRFDVGLAVEGEPLSAEEQAALLATTEGLALLRGRWVEVDAGALAQVMAQWEAAQETVADTGLSFLAGMRMLAGLPTEETPALPGTPAEQWSTVTAGPALRELLAELRAPARQPADAEVPGLQATLRPYQAQGLAWLHTLSSLGLGALLADDMGLGKTLQVLALLLRDRQAVPNRPPCLVVVPTSLLPNWQSEAARFTPALRVAVAHPSAGRSAADAAPDRAGRPWQGAHLVLTTYGMLHRDGRLAETAWDLLVLDEAQAIKTPSTRRARAVRAIQSRSRILLTGTPIENRVGDLWALFDVANPGLLGTSAQFLTACKAMGEDYRPLRRLVGPYILRRLKSDPDVAADLPEKTETTVWCSLGRRQAALYTDTVDRLAHTLETEAPGAARRGAVLAALTRLKQLCNHPGLPGGDPETADAEASLEDSSGKLQALARLARQLGQRQERVLVFTQYRRMMAPLATTLSRAFGRPGLELHGGTPVAERAARVEAFQDPDGPPFFVLSLRAAGTGLNLTAASHVVHFDRWWNPAVENQATDRAHRIGQHKAVLVHRFICRGTVEERIDKLIADKAALADDIVGRGPAGPSITELDDEALLAMVSLDLRTALTGGAS
jgi:non-specific serine/threonine protein kinase